MKKGRIQNTEYGIQKELHFTFHVLRFTLFLLFTFHVSRFTPLVAQPKAVPYYQFQFGEGISIPSKGDFFANQELTTRLGSQITITDRINLFGMYDLTYEGPGLIRQEGRLFSERAIRHSILLEPSVEVDYLGRVKVKLFRINEDRRSGTNELWGKGLYDYNAEGVAVSLQKELFGFQVEPGGRKTTMKFPNYTDLLRDFQSAGLSAELSGGLIDQEATAMSLSIRRGKFFIDGSQTIQKYEKERVIQSNGTYSDEKQKDINSVVSGGMEGSLWRFTLVPKASLTRKRSNQNFLRFAFVGDTSPVFVAKNYDYDEYNVGSTLYLRTTPTKALFGSIQLYDRKHIERNARDSSNNYTNEKQHSLLGTWSAGLQWKVSQYSTWSLAYNFVFSQSNMKFEKFIPYNYTGHVVGLYLSVQP